MKRIGAFALALVLLAGLPCLAAAEEPDWVGVYSALLDEIQAEALALGQEISATLYSDYVLYDKEALFSSASFIVDKSDFLG